MTEEQLELLRDKFVLWDRQYREGPMDTRDYNKRAAEALKALLSEQVEYSSAPRVLSREELDERLERILAYAQDCLTCGFLTGGDLGNVLSIRDEANACRALLSSGVVGDGWRPTDVLGEIALERQRQIEVEGWSAEHDDTEHDAGALADAAACYAATQPIYTWRSDLGNDPELLWPWQWRWFKRKDRRRDLIRAGALIAAEIERLDRLPGPAEGGER